MKLKNEMSWSRTFINSFEVDYSEIKFGDIMAKGAFGEIYKAMFRENKVAVKKLKKEHQKEGPIKDILNECSAL